MWIRNNRVVDTGQDTPNLEDGRLPEKKFLLWLDAPSSYLLCAKECL